VIPKGVTGIGSDAFYNCNKLTIYCEIESLPDGWSSSWNSSNRPVAFGYTGEIHTYTFEVNGGNAISSMSSAGLITLPTPVKSGSYFGGWYDNAEFAGKALTSPYYGKPDTTLYAKWLTAEEYNAILNAGASYQYAIAVECGTYDVVIDEPGESVYYVFTPTESRSYRIKSSGGCDTYGYLYNSSKTQLAANDDSRDNDEDFGITYSLTAGQTYYIVVKLYSATNTGSFSLVIT
jgi:hypothetical protein